MRYVLFCPALLYCVMLSSGPVQDQHPEVPSYCTHDTAAPPVHQCKCKRSCTKDENGKVVIMEDPECTTHCKPERCSCVIKGCEHT